MTLGLQAPHQLQLVGRLDLAMHLVDAQALADVEQALAFKPTHLSCYQLTLEPNTYFATHPPVLPDEDEITQGIRLTKDGKVVCFFQAASKFKARYATFGFNDAQYWAVLLVVGLLALPAGMVILVRYAVAALALAPLAFRHELGELRQLGAL